MNIATVISGRADYAPLFPVIRELELRGHNVTKLCPDGGLQGDTPFDCSIALANIMTWLSEQFRDHRPDLVLVLGDRYEILGACQVATLFRIPIAHIHGGETTEGSFDNQFRHAITQLASVHFVAAQSYAEKVISLGANPRVVHLVGAPGLDNIVDLPEREFSGPYFVIAYHPETLGETQGHTAILKALEAFPEYGAIWVGVNNDPDHVGIRDAFYNAERIQVFDKMGPKRYLSLVKHAACCIGNSSSFLIEAPALCVPAVNVGDRQKGRLRGSSVFDCEPTTRAIVIMIEGALYYGRSGGPFDNPYGQPGASKRIADILTQHYAEVSATERKEIA